MKRGPPSRNGGPPPKRSAPSGPMSRRKYEGILLVLTLTLKQTPEGVVNSRRNSYKYCICLLHDCVHVNVNYVFRPNLFC